MFHDLTQAHHNRQYSSGRVTIPTLRPPPDKTQHSEARATITQTGLEPTFPTSERPHTFALDLAASENQLALYHLFMDSNSVFIKFLKSLSLLLVNINQYNLQVTFVYIFHEYFLS